MCGALLDRLDPEKQKKANVTATAKGRERKKNPEVRAGSRKGTMIDLYGFPEFVFRLLEAPMRFDGIVGRGA